MKKIIALILTLGSFTAFAGTGRCDLQVDGLSQESADYHSQVKAILKNKGYTNIKFIRRDEVYKRLVLHFDTETPSFNFTQYSQMVLADEKVVTTDKYLFVAKKKSYRLGSSETYLMLVEELPGCNS